MLVGDARAWDFDLTKRQARNVIVKDLNKPGPDTAEDLYNGAMFSDLLVIFDDEYKPDELEENLALASKDLPIEGRQRNMHIIRKALRSLIRRQLEVVEVLLDDVDFQALDRSPNNQGMCQILSIFLVISVNLPDRFVSQEILQDMQKTTEDKNRLGNLMQIMNQSQNRIKQGGQAEPTESSQAASSAPVQVAGMDELALEAELARLHRDIESLKKRNADLVTVHERLQESHQELLERHENVTANRDKLQELLESGAYGDGAEKKKQLQEQNRLIDNLEMQLDDARRAKEELERAKVRLEAELSKLVPLAQEYQDLKQENEDLTKKANAAEHLKQKLEKLRGLENEVKKLREERNAFFEGQEQMMSFQKQVIALSAERDQQSRNMQAYEIQVSEFNAQKMAWNMEYQKLQRHLESLETKSKDDEEMVRDLQEKVMLLDPSAVTDASYSGRTQSRSLEDELEGSPTHEAHTLKDLEISRLQTENALLKSSIGSETEKGQLFQQIEKEQDARKALQEKYNALFEKHVIERAALDALTNKQENEALATLRKQALTEESRAKDLASRLEATQMQLKDKERGLTEAQGDLQAIREGQDMLTELKNTDGLLAASLRAELASLRKKHDNLKYDFDSRQEQLVSALLDKDQLRREVEAANAELQKAAEGGHVNPDVTKTMEKIEKLRVRYKQLSEQFDKSEAARRDLEKTLRALKAGSADGEQDKTKDQIIKNLQRENAMISTAWYDLTSRLQSNHVVLQRRNDAPKSWLNKQRQLVNGKHIFKRSLP